MVIDVSSIEGVAKASTDILSENGDLCRDCQDIVDALWSKLKKRLGECKVKELLGSEPQEAIAELVRNEGRNAKVKVQVDDYLALLSQYLDVRYDPLEMPIKDKGFRGYIEKLDDDKVDEFLPQLLSDLKERQGKIEGDIKRLLAEDWKDRLGEEFGEATNQILKLSVETVEQFVEKFKKTEPETAPGGNEG